MDNPTQTSLFIIHFSQGGCKVVFYFSVNWSSIIQEQQKTHISFFYAKKLKISAGRCGSYPCRLPHVDISTTWLRSDMSPGPNSWIYRKLHAFGLKPAFKTGWLWETKIQEEFKKKKKTAARLSRRVSTKLQIPLFFSVMSPARLKWTAKGAEIKKCTHQIPQNYIYMTLFLA